MNEQIHNPRNSIYNDRSKYKVGDILVVEGPYRPEEKTDNRLWHKDFWVLLKLSKDDPRDENHYFRFAYSENPIAAYYAETHSKHQDFCGFWEYSKGYNIRRASSEEIKEFYLDSQFYVGYYKELKKLHGTQESKEKSKETT